LRFIYPLLVNARASRTLGRIASADEGADERLLLEFGDDPMMQVSHETIYQSLFVQDRGELRRELARCLRSGRTARRHQGRVEKRGKNPDMVMISERPAEIEDRARTNLRRDGTPPPSHRRLGVDSSSKVRHSLPREQLA
jgi:hypothetical protein